MRFLHSLFLVLGTGLSLTAVALEYPSPCAARPGWPAPPAAVGATSVFVCYLG